jgi:gamma-glutamyltranspeptidase/glutathione hydrolase
MKKTVWPVFFVLISGWMLALSAADRVAGPMHKHRSEVIAARGMVATSHPLAAQIGLDILKSGGNAVDAAIAVNAALGLMEPTGSGVGGDLFAIVWDAKSQKLYGLNSSGPAPERLTLQIFRDQGLAKVPVLGPLPWTVPGCVGGWQALHKRFGRMALPKVLAPAIHYARAGVPLPELIAFYWARSVAAFKGYENFQALYAPGGVCPKKGDIFKNPLLAATLEKIAASGGEAFYRGEIAQAMVAYSDKVGGYFSLEDFKRYQAEWVDPIGVRYRGYDVWELPPNGQGLAALQMLNMLEEFDLKTLGRDGAELMHTLIEVKKLAFEDRARFYADPRMAHIPQETLLSKAYAQKRLKLFNNKRAAREIPPDPALLEHGGTVYLTVVDAERNAVSLIQSNYFGFGSGMVPDGLGFCLQDRGAGFALDESHPNCLAPGKRPFHTIIPAFVTRNNRPVFSFGVMGGAMQPQGHVQVLVNLLDFGMDPQAAGDYPRFRHDGSTEPDGGAVMKDGGEVLLESGFSMEMIRELLARGHRIRFDRGGYGGYQGIWIDEDQNVLRGGSESRSDGAVVGW